MLRLRGFTIIEVLVTIVIMLILMVLGVASFNNIQAQGRDSQRATDVQALATGLEQYYKFGNPTSVSSYITQGTYPGYCDMEEILGIALDSTCSATFCSNFTNCPITGGYATTAFPGVTTADQVPPSPPKSSAPNIYIPVGTISSATTTAITTNLTNGSYVYIPLNRGAATSYCAQQCPSFQLQYKTEVNPTVITINSKHQ